MTSMFRIWLIGVLILSSCSGAAGTLAVLDDAPIHSEVADLMPPGRLAMLQVSEVGNYQWDMEPRANAAAALWNHWADDIDSCFADAGVDQTVPRFEAPSSDDPIWDLMREPDHEFRPYDEVWNREHGFASDDPNVFWASDEVAYLRIDSPELLDSDCANSTYPYDMLIGRPGSNETHSGFLDSLAVQLLEQLEPVEWDETELEALDEIRGELNLPECLADGGVPQWVLESDYWELFAGAQGSRPLDEAAQYSVVEAECFDEVFTPVDDELLEIADTFVEQNEDQLVEALRVDERVADWIDLLDPDS